MSIGNMSTIMLYFGGGMGNPIDMETKAIEMELKLRNRKKDPELPPEKEPGDIYVLIGVLVGFLGGGFIGFLILSSGLFSTAYGLFGIVFGAIAGGVIGSFIGGAIKKRKNKKDGDDFPQGPLASG